MKHNRNLRTSRNRSFRTAFEAMEPRQLMSSTSIRTINSGGPDYSMVESNGTVYAISSSASGAGANQIWQATGGGTGNSKLLIDGSSSSAKIGSFQDLVVAGDGKVYFTANATGGRQIFQLTSKGYAQLTTGSNVFYQKLTTIGSTLFFVESNNQKVCTFDSNGAVRSFATGNVSKMFGAKEQLFYTLSGSSALYRSNGFASGTYRIDGNLSASESTIFVSNDNLFFNATVSSTSNLYMADGSNVAPTMIATDFAVRPRVPVAVVGTDVYFSGAYYNTSPNAAGQQLYRITQSGTLTKATNFGTANGGGAPEGLAVIGNSIYMTAGDTEFIASAGTADKELYRYDTTTGVTKLVTTNNDLYPIEINSGVLSSYYFVAAPTKADSRFGSRRLYRTSPTNDQVEEIGGLPSYTSGSATKQDVSLVFGGSKGLFYSARNNDGTGGDYDVYFVATPFSYIDPASHDLIVEATDSADTMDVSVNNGDIVLTLNGTTERWDLADFGTVRINMKGGDDKLTTSLAVDHNMDIKGDSGNDTLMGGSGNDSLLGGAGKNFMYGQAGTDRLRGGNGYDWMNGGDDKDRLYGRGGGDNIRGGNGVDYLYGDDGNSSDGNDTLAGDQSADRLYGYGGNDLLVGGTQNDQIWGGAGNDTLQGQDGNDVLQGDAGLDELWGLDGDDLLVANDGEMDKLYGGNGTDTAQKDSNESVIELIEL
jgi:Ca2+-binding RTX toxin-like protein